MIEKMKKVYIVSTAEKKQQMLDALMDLGAVHIAEKKSADKDIAAKFSEMSRTAIALKEYADKNTPKEPVLSDVDFSRLYKKVRLVLTRKAELLQERNDAAAFLFSYIAEDLPIISLLFARRTVYTHRETVTGISPAPHDLFNKITEWKVSF